MFDSLIEDYWRGYTHEQYAEALYETLLNYLIKNDIINKEKYEEYEWKNFEKTLKEIVVRDKEMKENDRK